MKTTRPGEVMGLAGRCEEQGMARGERADGEVAKTLDKFDFEPHAILRLII